MTDGGPCGEFTANDFDFDPDDFDLDWPSTIAQLPYQGTWFMMERSRATAAAPRPNPPRAKLDRDWTTEDSHPLPAGRQQIADAVLTAPDGRVPVLLVGVDLHNGDNAKIARKFDG
ncbi:hypothetical protein ACWCXH_36775 [Kitasatospora sp. NPDC001660]